MNPQEAAAFLHAARENPDDLVFILALCTGMRPEEFIGLQWSEVEMATQFDSQTGAAIERGVAHVRRTILRRRGGGWYFGKPKSKKGERDVYFPASLYHDLMAHKERQAEQARRRGREWVDHDLVFTQWKGQPLERGNLYARRFKPLLQRAKLSSKFTLYSLRYTYATLSMLAGEADKVISDQMGHARVDFTKDVYMRVLPEMKQAASDRLEKLLFSDSCTLSAHIEAQEIM